MPPTPRQKIAKIRVAGPDKTGIIATVTSYLAKNRINIEDIDQRILEGVLVMNMVVDIKRLPFSLKEFEAGLKNVAKKIDMEITFQKKKTKRIKDIALLVTKEPHCLLTIINGMKEGKIRGRPAMICGNRTDLKPIADRHGIPFYYSPSTNKKEHEELILEKLGKQNIDLVVLARYMQILSPEFCFRYEGKMINIHPSLLPAFPGARAYSQAFNKGVEVVGVTAHFVTTDLDQGPIITQGSFNIDKIQDDLDQVVKRGKRLEATVLARAVKLYCEDRLVLRRGKVIDSRQLHQFEEKMKRFYK